MTLGAPAASAISKELGPRDDFNTYLGIALRYVTAPDDTRDFFNAILTLSGALWVLSLAALQPSISDLNANKIKANARYARILAASVILFADMVASSFRILPLSAQGQLKGSVLIATIIYLYPITGYWNKLCLNSARGRCTAIGLAIVLLSTLGNVCARFRFGLSRKFLLPRLA